MYTPAQTRDAETVIGLLAKAAMRGRPPHVGPLSLAVEAVFVPPASWSRKKRQAALSGDIAPTGKPDLDNVLKLVADGMNGIVYDDDAQAVSAQVRKRYGSEARTICAVSWEKTK